MAMLATAAVVHEANGPFSFEDVEIEDLRSDEVLVRIEASGICHTDLVAQRLTPLPAVFGHEGAGIVEAVGSAVSRVKKGERVIISYPFCGMCASCMEGHPYHCDDHMSLGFAGTRHDGSHTIKSSSGPMSGAFFQQSSFASYSITPERNVIPVGADHMPAMLAAIPCGVQTGAGSILNTLKVGPKEGLAVFGAGSVGLSAIMAGKLVGASPLIAVDVVEERLNLAYELGATHVINARDGDVVARILEIAPKGVNFSLETSANEQALNDAIGCLSTGGQCGMVIAPHFGETYPFSPTEIFRRAASLKGIIQGSSVPNTFLPKLIEFNRQGRFPYDRLITTYDFSDINRAIDEMKNGKTIKPVLLMDK
ncbi:NAD(P)-dependent alcohol dehydrogenase [Sulfuriflexus mobilis]|uniref:NAD(P)-dependent alcohol dehydrogenase n=1 Tax=Sulfuriflexus mobilis TaxID=1811807 RepID=UPI000F824C74|nr:NAD(P)-dependent alcohol dehydrogenase [Sulfuriflexus mobilis]